MKTLIFEGIATSGKSTITDYLVKSLKDEMIIELATEEQTHEPIMAQRSKLNTLFFEELINKLTLKHPGLLIFDRLYITQAYRAKSDLAEYSAVEDALIPYSPHTIILKVKEDAIAERIKAASEHRGAKWLEYWKTKGDTFEEIAQDYISQQRGILQLVKQSKIPYTVFDTTSHNYGTTTEEIIKTVRQ
jgi:thymidylate kinase